MPEPPQGVTRLLERVRDGDRDAAEELFATVYDELHGMAHRKMREQAPGHTLQSTALVNEAYIRVFRREWEDGAHFRAVAARAMRSILVDHARRKRSAKRTPDGERIPLEALTQSYEERSGDLLALDAALDRLGKMDPEMVRLVELRFFAGQTMADAAEALGVSLRTAEREWAAARAWLREELK